MRLTKNCIFLCCSILFHSIMNAGPYQFRRIILLNDKNKIIKSIDLISDIHAPSTLQEIVKRPSRRGATLLKLAETTAFTTSERGLLITLRKLAQKNSKIDLLWELLDSPTEKSPSELQWMYYGGLQLSEEFSPRKNRSIIFQNADSYRKPLAIANDLTLLNPGHYSTNYLNDNPSLGKIPLFQLSKYLKKLIDPEMSPVVQDLKKIKESPFSNMYDVLIQLWERAVKNVLTPLNIFLQYLLSQNPSITINEARSKITNNKDLFTKFMRLIANYDRITDIEILIKLFASANDHTIIYAGGWHIDTVASQLLNIKSGIVPLELINIGTSWEDRKGTGYPVLDAAGWSYLEESPQTSYNRYKQRGHSLINLADKKIWDQFSSLNHEISKAQEKNDQEIYKQLDDFYKVAKKSYIDFINTRDTKMNTLLVAAVEKNLFKSASFLIRHGARVNIQNDEGNTPLHYARSAEIAQMLLEHGAKTDTKNAEGLTPLLRAEKQSNNGVIEIIKKFAEEKLKKKRTSRIKSENEPFKESKQEIPEASGCEIPESKV
ncbi:MAG TPA: ankyrin repeat domain-containing protein [Candidatus Babeliales bacterium]|nr:ankyrin repeat domain-containing protein [Candidatus Babeliales bacterium]